MTVTPYPSANCRKSLDDAMDEHVAYIVLSIGRPFTYLDLLRFEVDGEIYEMSHGTFRNKIRDRKMSGKIELDHRSTIAFYTLAGKRFARSITPYQASATCHKSLLDFILSLPYGQSSIHNIRLKFKVKGLWELFCDRGCYMHPVSNDIRIASYQIHNLFVGVVIHKTDTVTVNVACSYDPVVSEVAGGITLSNALSRVVERLVSLTQSTKK